MKTELIISNIIWNVPQNIQGNVSVRIFGGGEYGDGGNGGGISGSGSGGNNGICIIQYYHY